MPALSIGAYFTSRAIMLAETAGGPVRWASTLEWEAANTGGLPGDDTETVINALVGWHRSVLLNNFYVERIDISSAVEDGVPYDPQTFVSRTVMLRGLFGGSDGVLDLLPLTSCLLVKKVTDAGREGNMLLRGLLRETDISSDALTGAVTLVTRAGLQSSLITAWAALLSAVEGVATPVMFNVSGDAVTSTRPVSTVFAKTHTVKKLNNKYFDKRQAPGSQAMQLLDQYGPAVVTQIIEALLAGGADLPALPGA